MIIIILYLMDRSKPILLMQQNDNSLSDYQVPPLFDPDISGKFSEI